MSTPSSTGWVSAALGAYHTAGEQSCPAFWAWGRNAYGEVGNGSTAPTIRVPVPVLPARPIALFGFSLTSAPPGASVTVTGMGLQGLTTLTVNGANALASVTNNSSTGFTFVVPAGAVPGMGTVTIAAGCGTVSSTSFIVVAPLAMALSKVTAGLCVYPNPAHGAVALSGWPARTPLTVFDALGRTVTTATTATDGTAQLLLPAGLAPGIYVVRCGGLAVRLAVE